jgi:hypothetical protein
MGKLRVGLRIRRQGAEEFTATSGHAAAGALLEGTDQDTVPRSTTHCIGCLVILAMRS